jgi:hypothetical protein
VTNLADRTYTSTAKCPVCEFTQTITKPDTAAGRAEAEQEARSNIGGHLTEAHPASPVYMASEKCSVEGCKFLATAYDVDTEDGRDRATESVMEIIEAHALAEHGTIPERVPGDDD